MKHRRRDARRRPSLNRRGHAAAGSLLLIIGTTVVAMCLMERAGGVPVSMPRSWYINQPLWFLLGLTAFVAGWMLVRQAPDTPFQSLVLYTRTNCGLCTEAKGILNAFRRQLPPLMEVDIDHDPELRKRFDTCVPVVEIDGKVRFRGQVNPILLRRLIASAGSGPDSTDMEERNAESKQPHDEGNAV